MKKKSQQIFESWPGGLVDRNFENVSTALKILVDDADQRTRSLARSAFTALHSKLPARAEQFLKVIPQQTADKLQLSLSGVLSPSSPANAQHEGFNRRMCFVLVFRGSLLSSLCKRPFLEAFP